MSNGKSSNIIVQIFSFLGGLFLNRSFIISSLILLLLVGFISSNKGFTNSYLSPYVINHERVSIEKEFNCRGVSCLKVIPFESQKSEITSLLDFTYTAKYNGKDEKVIKAILNKDVKTKKWHYSFFKGLESYFSNAFEELFFIVSLILFGFYKFKR